MSPKNLFRSRCSGLVLGAAVALWAAPTLAASKPKVLVLPYQHLNSGMPDDLGEQTTVVVAREMAAQGINVIRADGVAGESEAPAAEATSADAPTGDPDAQAQAEKFMGRAREAMDDSDFGRASKMLGRAAKLMESNGDAVADLRLLPEIYIQAGVAYFRDGMEDEGDDMLNQAVHLDPERTLDPADYPPIFIRVFDRARFNVLRRPRARIEVKAKAGATVLFDGRNLGKAPIVLEEALPGRHWIRVEQPGETVQVRTVQARGGKTLVVDFAGAGEEAPSEASSAGVMGAIAANKVEPAHIGQMSKAGKTAGADFVLFGGIYKTDTAYQIRSAYVDVRSGKAGRLTEIAFDLDMLSAEIEVFKLVDDAKNQAEAGALSAVESESPFVLARKLRAPRQRRIAVAGVSETKLTTVVAAPAPIEPPRPPEIADIDTGRAPTAKASSGPMIKRPVDKTPTLIPKDEVGAVASANNPPAPPAALSTQTLVPKDERKDDDGGSLWWLWIVAGVAAAGAATAGGILLAGSGNSDQGNLTINW